MKNQDLQQLMQQVAMYLDNELSESDERDLLRKIKTNPTYLKVLSQEKTFRAILKSKVYQPKPSPSLIQSIKEKIRTSTAKSL